MQIPAGKGGSPWILPAAVGRRDQNLEMREERE